MENIFAQRLKKLRIKRGMTQDTLAKYLGVNRMTIVQWEKGVSHPNYGVLRNIAHCFHVDVPYLYGDDDFTIFLIISADIFTRKTRYFELPTRQYNEQKIFAEWVSFWSSLLIKFEQPEFDVAAEIKANGCGLEIDEINLRFPQDYSKKILNYIIEADNDDIPNRRTLPNTIKEWCDFRILPPLYYDLTKL